MEGENMIKKFLFIIFFISPIFMQDAYLNKSFPIIEGISLSGNKVVFPDVVIGKPTVLAIAFRRNAQNCINSWVVDDLLIKYGVNKSINYYEIPMLGGQYKMARNWIDGGMRGGVPKFLHDYTVTYYGPLRSYFKSLDIQDRGDCYMFVLDSKGVVVERFTGYSSQQDLKKMYELIDLLNG